MEFNDEDLFEIVDALDAHISCIGGLQKEKLAIHDRIKDYLESKGYVVGGGGD
ncbi:hypothetical protein [Paenibacillus taichungensis]